MGDAEEDPFYERRTIFEYAKDMLLAPIRIATSPTLLRTYLRTALLLLASFVLFGAAVVAYTSFYYTYIPVRGVSVPVYLQYDHTSSLRFPFGIARVHGLASRQKYDVEVQIELPRSERNLAAGNWMVGIEMRGPGFVGGGVKSVLGWEEEWDVVDYSQSGDAGKRAEKVPGDGMVGATTGREKAVVLARSRRPAILTYRSWMAEMAYRAARMPLYVLGWGLESETVVIKMMEGVEFDKGWRNVPDSLRLELRSRAPLEVYSVKVQVAAKLEGLRWLMFHYKLSSFVVATSVFWGVEMSVVLLTWLAVSLCFGASPAPTDEDETSDANKIKVESGTATPKTEPADSEAATPLSDTSRTFPTLSSQQPLHYTSRSEEQRPTAREVAQEDVRVKREEEADDEDDDESADFVLEEPVPARTAEGLLTDSGIGTSLESGVERAGVARRRSGREERERRGR